MNSRFRALKSGLCVLELSHDGIAKLVARLILDRAKEVIWESLEVQTG
jgi:hypothetical protein